MLDNEISTSLFKERAQTHFARNTLLGLKWYKYMLAIDRVFGYFFGFSSYLNIFIVNVMNYAIWGELTLYIQITNIPADCL